MDSFWIGLKHSGGYLCNMATSLVHFVGFRDDRYWNAVRIWGAPDMIHEAWDCYAADDTSPDDIVIFAEGEWNQKKRSFTVEAARSKEARRNGRALSG